MLSAGRCSAISLDWAELWNEFGALYIDRVTSAQLEDPRDFEGELLFCLLGGHGVTFELARSAVGVLGKLDVFSPDWDSRALETAIAAQLETAQFVPTRRDGSPRRYRYPRRKAQLIARAAAWVVEQRSLREVLLAFSDERTRRDFLCRCPGVGLKTASWFLRNVGLGSSLAVIDVHLLRALASARRIGEVRLPRDYHYVEQRFLAWCVELDVPPAAFDLMLWEWQRAL